MVSVRAVVGGGRGRRWRGRETRAVSGRAVVGGGGGGRGRRSRRWRGRRGRGTGRRNCGGVGGSRAVGKKCGGAEGSRAGLSRDRSRVIPVLQQNPRLCRGTSSVETESFSFLRRDIFAIRSWNFYYGDSALAGKPIATGAYTGCGDSLFSSSPNALS